MSDVPTTATTRTDARCMRIDYVRKRGSTLCLSAPLPPCVCLPLSLSLSLSLSLFL